MSTRIAADLAWAVLGWGLLVIVGSTFIGSLTQRPPELGTSPVNVYGASIVSFALLGALVAERRPGNRFGWLLSAIAFIHACGYLLQAIAGYLLYREAVPLPGASFVAWLFVWTAMLHYAPSLTFVFLLFPDGRLPSRRWRPVASLTLAATVVAAIGIATLPGPLVVFGFDNPYGVPGPLPLALASVGLVIGMGCVIACVASLFRRYRRAGGVERQQLKWFLLGGAIAAFVATFIVGSGLPIQPAAQLTSTVTIVMSVFAAVAIFRHHLYDIDLLINRTLVYGLTTSSLVVAFAAGIVVLQFLLSSFTSGSEIAVAGSTLGSVALSQPLRRRAQAAVDRRFYRSRYDASRVLDRFSGELAGEVDLGAVRARLLDAVGDALQPTSASVWLRERSQ